MAEERTVLLRVEIENQDLVNRSVEIRNELDKLKKKGKELQDDLKKADFGSEAYNKLQASITKNQAATNAYKKELQSIQKEIDTTIKLNNSEQGSNEQLRASLSLLTAQYNKLSEEERNNTELGKGLATAISNTTEALKENESAVGDNRRNVGNYEESLRKVIEELELQNVTLQKNSEELEEQQRNLIGFNRLSSEQEDELNGIVNQLNLNNQAYQKNNDVIKQVTSQIGFMSTKQKEQQEVTKTSIETIGSLRDKAAQLKKELENPNLGLDTFRELNEQLSDVELKIGQASGKLDEFGNKEPKNKIKKNLDDTSEAVGALSQSLGLLTVAFSDNENVQQLQERALKAIAISTTVANIAKARFAILDTIQLVKTKALTLAQNLYTQAIGKSTGAARIFKVALASTGIGAIVVLLGELIFNFDTVNKYVNRAINYIRDFSSEISGGNKIVKGFVEILLLFASPLVTIIRLISDFNGTITQLQNAINGAYDSLINLADGIPIVGTLLKGMKAQFNFVTNAIKSLDGSSKKYKVSVEELSKIYDDFTAQLEQNSKSLQRQIKLAEAQGQSEQKVANLTRDLLRQTTAEREKAYKVALEIQKRLIQENSKLTDEQQKLFDKVQNDFEDSKVEQEVFEANLLNEARQRAKERIKIEQDLTAELNALRISLMEDDFDRRQSELEEQLRLDKLQVEQQLKEAAANGTLSSKLREQLNEKLLLLDKKFQEEVFNLQLEELEQEADLNNEKLEQQIKAEEESFSFKSKALADNFALEMQFLEASFINTGKTEDEKVEQIRLHNIQKLELSKKYFEDQLKLAEEFAAEDAQLTDEELENLRAISQTISDINTQIATLNDTKNILGLTVKEMEALNNGAAVFLQTLQVISDVVNADFENRKRLIDDNIAAEVEAVEKSSLSQAAKDKKIKALEKKRAEEQYKIQLEQFEFQKATSIIQAIIQGALAFITALTSGVPPFNFINAGLVALSSGAQIGIIASQKPPAKPKFFGGGFTEQSGNPYLTSAFSDSSRDLHHNEYVTPWKVLRLPKAKPHIAALESMRLSTPGSLGLKGFADGGLNARALGASVTEQAEVAQIISNEVARNLSKVRIEVAVSEIDRVKAESGKARAKATV